ncbi:type VI secretion system baseplate subunit TssE [soil metagenome]
MDRAIVNTLLDTLNSTDESTSLFLDETDLLLLSIQNHLVNLLNTRQGMLQHLPDYGLPDITAIYQGMPYSISYLLKTITAVIEKYEPRLHCVIVKHNQQHDKNCVLNLEIRAQLINGGNIQFATYFLSGGKAMVELT